MANNRNLFLKGLSKSQGGCSVCIHLNSKTFEVWTEFLETDSTIEVFLKTWPLLEAADWV